MSNGSICKAFLTVIEDCDLRTQHRAGKDNANADALSRLFHIPEDINIKLSNHTEVISYQAYASMEHGARLATSRTYTVNQIMTEGVGDLRCEVCKDTHTRIPMLICECCGLGYHTECMTPKVLTIPKDAWYCVDCLKSNETV